MPFVPRDRATIRASLLSDLAARYAATPPAGPGVTLDTSQGSDPYLWADALAVELENTEAQAAANALNVLPDKADSTTLDRFGAVYGLPRNAAVATRLSLGATGTNGTYAVTGLTLIAPNGSVYTPESPTLTIAAGVATFSVVAQTAGSAANQADGAILSWSSAPAGVAATATVVSSGTLRPGTDAESDASYSLRIVAKLQFHPASGNAADWQSWTTAFQGVSQAFVYSLLQPPGSYPGAGTTGVPGCVTVVAMGPAQGDSATNSRILGTTGAKQDGTSSTLNITGYIEGTVTATGAAGGRGYPLRAVTMLPGDYSIEAMQTQSQDVELQIVVDTAHAFQWSGSPSVDGSSTSASLVVSGNYSPSGTDLTGKKALVYVGGSLIRGGYQVVTLPNGTYAGGLTTFAVTMLGAPSGLLYPYSSTWEPLRLAIFALFDALGPGDVGGIRFPSPSTSSPATLYVSSLVAAAMAVPGVLSVAVVTPGGTGVSPSGQKIVVTLGKLAAHA